MHVTSSISKDVILIDFNPLATGLSRDSGLGNGTSVLFYFSV